MQVMQASPRLDKGHSALDEAKGVFDGSNEAPPLDARPRRWDTLLAHRRRPHASRLPVVHPRRSSTTRLLERVVPARAAAALPAAAPSVSAAAMLAALLAAARPGTRLITAIGHRCLEPATALTCTAYLGL